VRQRRIVLLLGAVLAAAVVGVFSSGLHGQMMFDDYRGIVANSDIGHFPDVLRGSTRPLTEFTFFLNYALHGASVEPYHVVNILIHALAALLLFGIVRRTLLLPRFSERYVHSAAWLAAVASGLWALHPLQTESVTYIVQRAESMMGMFALLTLYAFLRGSTGERAPRWFGVAIASAVLGMLSKPVMIVVPLLVLLYDFVFLGGRRDGRWRWHLGLWATCLISIVLLVLPNESSSSAGVGAGRPGPWIYLLTQCDVVVHYIRLCIWPDPLCIDYAWPPAGGVGDVWCSAAALGVVAVLSVWLLRRRQATGYLGCWFLLALAPSSSVIPIDDLAAERRMYLALAAVAVLAVLAVWEALRWVGARLQWSVGHRVALAVLPAVSVLAALSLVTVHRNGFYDSEEKMWRDVLETRPENLRARLGLGALALAQGLADVAEAEFETVLSRLPDVIPDDSPSAVSTLYSLTKTNLGVLREQQGRFDEAEACFREAIRVSQQNADARVNLGIVLSRTGTDPESKRLWEEAISIEAHHIKARFCLGWLALKEGNGEAAREHLEHAACGRGELAERAGALLKQCR
jgi:tetratricopeptide (TPR) repeat protein